MGFYFHEWLHTIFILGGSFIANNHLGAGHLLWFYRFVEWWGNAKYLDSAIKIGQLISLKILPILGDAVVALIIYRIILKKVDKTRARLAAVIYLISPFSWYESALWGQNDQLGLIFLVAAFWFIFTKKWVWLSPLMMTISVLLKPTAFIFGPLLLWIAIKDRTTIKQVIVGGVVALGGYFWLSRMFSSFDFWQFNLNLQRQIFIKGEMWTWLNSFNFWRIITGFLTDYRQLFLGINLKIWGYIMFLGVNILAFKIALKRDWEGVLKAIFIIAIGGWMTMVTMHERYLFPAIVVGLILAAENLKLMKYWVVLSLVFAVNMFTGWWYPESWWWLKNFLIWGGNIFDGPVPKILAGVNLVLMIVMIKILFSSQEESRGNRRKELRS
jgi:Gpi18-like mannosyltransferase